MVFVRKRGAITSFWEKKTRARINSEKEREQHNLLANNSERRRERVPEGNLIGGDEENKGRRAGKGVANLNRRSAKRAGEEGGASSARALSWKETLSPGRVKNVREFL